MGNHGHIPMNQRLNWAKKNWTVAQCSKFLLGFALHLQIKVPEFEGRVEKHSFQSVMICSAMSSAGVGPLCFIKSKVNKVTYQEVSEYFMLLSAHKLYGDADFLFQRDLALAQYQNYYWFTRHDTITVFDWPANSPDLNSRQSTGYCQEEDEKHPNQQYRRAEGHYESTLAFNNGSAMPQADRPNAMLH